MPFKNFEVGLQTPPVPQTPYISSWKDFCEYVKILLYMGDTYNYDYLQHILFQPNQFLVKDYHGDKFPQITF